MTLKRIPTDMIEDRVSGQKLSEQLAEITTLTTKDIYGRVGSTQKKIISLNSWHEGKSYGGGVLIWDSTLL